MLEAESLEGRIVDILIEILESNVLEAPPKHEKMLKLIAKYKSRLGPFSWMKRKFDANESI